MMNINLNNPNEVRIAGLKALKDALGPVGMVYFLQQFDLGHGDYTQERYAEEDIDLDEIDNLLKERVK